MFFLKISVRSVTQKYLEKIGEVNFDKIFNQRLGNCQIPYIEAMYFNHNSPIV